MLAKMVPFYHVLPLLYQCLVIHETAVTCHSNGSSSETVTGAFLVILFYFPSLSVSLSLKKKMKQSNMFMPV